MIGGEDWSEQRTEWKSKIRALQLRIRDRFRVVVDRHRQRYSPGLLVDSNSSTLQRWVLRICNFRASSSQPPFVFYRRKRVSTDIDVIEDSIIIRMLQAVAVPVIGNACHVFMHGLNHVQVYGAEKLHQALLHRPKDRPLITVSNHVASVDDPFVIASLLPPNILLDANNLRWTLCATDRCFRNPVTSAFFRSVKVLPVARGDGVYQRGMDLALSKLNKGGWVHIFPEGSRSRDGGRTMASSKRGVGRLVMDADNIPLVVPFVHTGMQDVMPIGSHFPRIGKKVTVLIGEPIHFDDLLHIANDPQQFSRGALYDAVSSRIGHRLQELKTRVDRLVLEQSFQLVKDISFRNAERANGILQQVDWEAFGLGSFLFSEDSSPSLIQAVDTQPSLKLDDPRDPDPEPANRYVGVGFSREGGIISRLRGFMNPTELMGFAAKGLLMNGRNGEEKYRRIGEVGPVKAWRLFLEANVFQQWSYM